MQWAEYTVLIGLAAGKLTMNQAASLLERSPASVQELLDSAIEHAELMARGPKRARELLLDDPDFNGLGNHG